MYAVILAAGMGTRLRPLTEKIPKPLLKINNKSIIEHEISGYLSSGIKENNIYVVVGYKGDVIKKSIKLKFPKVRFIMNKKYKHTNNMFSLLLALKRIMKRRPSTVLINNGDCIYDRKIYKILKDSEEDVIFYEKGLYLKESMKIKVKGNRVLEISKKIDEKSASGVSIDLYKFSWDSIVLLKRIIEGQFIKKKKFNLWTEEAINVLLKSRCIKPVKVNGSKWEEIDDFNDFISAEVKFSNISLKNKKAILVDLDGTLYKGKKIIREAVSFIRKYRKRFKFYFISNNTSRSSIYYVKKISKLIGMKIKEENIILPTQSLIKFLKKEKINKIFCLGTKEFISELETNGINVFRKPRDDIQAVVVGFDKELNYKKLKTAVELLMRKKVKYFATHEDILCPTENGFIPDIGPIIAFLRKATKRVPEKVFGKPNVSMIEEVLSKFKRDEILLVGDRIYTDMKMAESAGIDFILVLTGETSAIEAQLKKNTPVMVENLGQLEMFL